MQPNFSVLQGKNTLYSESGGGMLYICSIRQINGSTKRVRDPQEASRKCQQRPTLHRGELEREEMVEQI